MPRYAVLAAVLALAGCRSHRDGGPLTQVRLGYFPNLTHGAALVGMEHGEFARALAPLTVEPKLFNAGPEAMEALFAGALDACYVGSMPALNGFLRSDGKAVVVIAGAASGGAALVVRTQAHIDGPDDLHGKRLASPQLGNTQDIALRSYLKRYGLRAKERGGDVQVLPMANPDILSLMKRGQLDGAWVPEPWTTRLLHEAGAQILIEDKDFWPGMPTAVLVVAKPFADAHPDVVRKLVAAHGEAVRFIAAHSDEARGLAAQAITRAGGKPPPPDQLAEAWARIEFTADPRAQQIAAFAAEARLLGYLPLGGDARALVDPRFAPDAGPP